MTISESTTNNHFELTQSAIRHFSSLLRNKENQNIRIGIRDSGCSGYAYFLEFSESINNDDLEFNFEDFKNFFTIFHYGVVRLRTHNYCYFRI